MIEHPFGIPLSVDDPEAMATLSRAIREWEPSLDVQIPRRDAILYEPDGTLYAFVLSNVLNVRTDRRDVAAHRGDVLVLPRAYALDAVGQVDVLGIRHDGPPPDHFRERFIQVWGFEHFEAPGRSEHGRFELIEARSSRHRLSYSILDLEPDRFLNDQPTEIALYLGLSGDVQLFLDDSAQPTRLSERSLLATIHGAKCILQGTGRIGRIALECDLSYSAVVDPPGASPEYRGQPTVPL